MRVIRFLLPVLAASMMLAVVVSAAQAAEVPVIEKLVASNCTINTCGQENVLGPFNEPKAEVSKEEAEKEGFTQAGGRVPYGVTDFKVLTTGNYPDKVPTSLVTHLRTDVAPGLATNPFAVPQCSLVNFGNTEAVPGSSFYAAPKCAGSEIGVNEVTVWLGPEAATDATLSGTVYNLESTEGLASEFGVALEVPIPISGGALAKGFKEAEEKGAVPGEHEFPTLGQQKTIEEQQYFAHTLIEGDVEWGKEAVGTDEGDYHDYFEINVSPKLPLIRSRLVFEGTLGKGDKTGEGDFITNATSCPGHNTTTLKMIDLEGNPAPVKTFTTPIGLSGCESLLFEPGFVLTSGTTGTTQSDQPDAFTAAASLPQEPTKPAQSQVKSASFTLPEGMTLNPSAANGLMACTAAQAHIHSERFGVECPEASRLGKVTLEVPTLPAQTPEGKSTLEGAAYLGTTSLPITGPPYTMYVVANSERYGVSVRLEAQVFPNETTGQVKAVFNEPPEQPFSKLAIHFERGALSPIANPLTCGAATASSSFMPFSGMAAQSPISGFVVDGNGQGGSCSASTLALTQSVSETNSTADAYTSYTVGLSRGDGQQYLTKVSTTLPEGLLGAVPSVTLCGEAEANAGTCSAASKIGTATVKVGAGSEPFQLSGPVYMTGPYAGAPYGLSIVVPAVAGPFNLGNEVVRATINVNPSTSQLTVTAGVPTIRGGIPFRLKNLSIAVEREKFLFNPTNCGVLSTATSLSGTPTLPPVSGATQGISTPFQVGGCSSLAFKPQFAASTNAKTSRAKGASLKVTIGYPTGPQANIKSVKVELPKQLPSRLTTLNKACAAAQFQSNPAGCPAASDVGSATATTPVLPDKLTGPAYLVSHGGAAFPDLEFVLSADNVTVILDGQTNIQKGITSSTFSSIPDAPVSSFELNLPTGAYSLLTANGNVCAQPLIMPTAIEGQSGAKITQSTKISVTGCGVLITAHKVKAHKAKITVLTPAAGKVTVSGKYLKSAKRTFSKAGKATLTVSLSKKGLAALRKSKKGKLKVKITVGFKPTKGSSSKTSVTVTFKR